MPFATALSSLQFIFLGLSILAVVFLLRRAAVLGKRSRQRDVTSELHGEMYRFEQTAASRILKLEVRLYDFGREVEGRMQHRITLLDQLTVDADREIDRLRSLIQQSRQSGNASLKRRIPDLVGPPVPENSGDSHEPSPDARPFPPAEQRMVGQLQQAGFSLEEISRLVDRPPAEIRSVIGNRDSRHQDKAA